MKYWFYHVVKAILWVFFRLRFGLEVFGKDHVPKTGPFILASNHLSFLDPPLLGAACPRRLGFMARSDLFRHTLLGAFMRGVHVIPLQRGEADPGAIREAMRRLHDGQAIAIFPEGGRQLTGQPGVARRGVGFLAVAARVPILPVLIRGTFEALPPDARRLHRAKIRVAFGTEISYTTSSVSSAPTSPEPRRFTPSSPGRATRSQTALLAEAITEQWRRLDAQRTP